MKLQITNFMILEHVCEQLRVPVSVIRMKHYLEGWEEPTPPQEQVWEWAEKYYNTEFHDSWEDFYSYVKSLMKDIARDYKYIRNIGFDHDTSISFQYSNTPPVTKEDIEQYHRDKRAYEICKEWGEVIRETYKKELSEYKDWVDGKRG